MMQINPGIIEILREYKIDKDQGLLFLLAVYFDLDASKMVSQEFIMAINVTKILDKDYGSDTIQWNIPLFQGQQTAFDWLDDWMTPFGVINPDRKGSPRDAVARMKDFFRKYPEYRKEDVYRARDMYLKSITDPRYLMKSHKFIFDGAGAMKKSTLLEYCEKLQAGSSTSNIKGQVIS